MSVIYVVHVEEDRTFVENRLIRPLPALGFDRWHSSARFPGTQDGLLQLQAAMRQCGAVLVVVPAAGFIDDRFRHEVESADAMSAAIVPVYLEPRTGDPGGRIPAVLRKYGGVDVPEARRQRSSRDLATALAASLPITPAAGGAESGPGASVPIGWNEDAFSELLAVAVGRHDDSRSDALVRTLVRYLSDGAYPYRSQSARADLSVLRKKRQFRLMRDYAAAVIGSGSADLNVRRQFAQSLIELKEFDRAAEVLTALVKDATAAGDDEQYEARGLIGRMLKQQYVDARRRAPGAKLAGAIDTYRSVFQEDSKHVWHGINAASCILRAHRDHVKKVPPKTEARRIAKKILSVLTARQRAAREKRLDVWDYATRVEALVALGEFTRAAKALDEYLVHPDMEAFEVSSTYRQFDEVLQLSKSKVKGARVLVERLAKAAERLRSGIIAPVDRKGTHVVLLRVSNAEWQGTHIPDLEVRSRMGTIISATGSAESVKALLRDPLVLGVEESRPAGPFECDQSMPFVRVKEKYGVAGADFAEKGSNAIIAVIDNGIDILHEAFLDASGQSRIIGIWDQQDQGTPPAGFTFGRYHTKEDIARYLADEKVPAALSRPNDGHGTHVTSIAAGRATTAFFGGVAPEAEILVVVSGGDQPTGYSDAHLAALKFIDQVATGLAKPVVVNLSQGMNAGAHDGQSALEVGFDMFSEGGRKPGRVVVKSAGNERGPIKGHARLTVPQGQDVPLVWRCPPGQELMRLELWWNSASRYSFQLKSPKGDVSAWVDATNPSVEAYFKKHGTYQLKLIPKHIDNGDSVLKIEVENGVGSSLDSDWTLTIKAVRIVGDAGVHAWLERGGKKVGFLTGTDDMTLTIPGTSRSVITVAAVEVNDTITVGDFSSFGPTRDARPKPDLCAPGVAIKAARRDTTDDVIGLNGTSMAAPHVTGAVALMLSKSVTDKQDWPTATQIAKTLIQNTRNFDGTWDPAKGFGVLDVSAIFEAN
jgi:subtilisin family serine protease